MRSLWLTVAAGAGLGLIFLSTSPANSITITAPAGARQAADALGLSEPVHCRKYAHRHRKGHRWGRGCRVRGAITGPRRSGVVVRSRRPLTNLPGVRAPTIGTTPARPLRPNPSNPQDRLGTSNPQDLTQPRAINPQDLK